MSGERYNVTLTNAGLNNRKQELAHFVIDEGPKRGVRMSMFLSSPLKKALVRCCEIPTEDTAALTLEAKHRNLLRLSAVVTVSRFAKDPHGVFRPVPDSYKETNVYVTYELSDFEPVTSRSELDGAFKRKETKFQRKPSRPKNTESPAA